VDLLVDADVSQKHVISIFARNVGINLQFHTTPKPKTSTTTR
jgi:hypothetical protein